ncbi:Gfo/Idh/MocA family oxidoreductase [Marinilongibacter aquaticus]|uniref:Gfo/Idh/MocA family protein n=1 Tax=Marinilongibacter aquaticus TaxID=2975157 RepID=UPI0021BD2A47|nr:Gfo/Idh/MocA family oxidoreductase [Marinilongibacter aquaticus]UBM58835.1 Gfo/Idh/MocA family oxidoreductase [Marinilongibacter aquaticus]
MNKIKVLVVGAGNMGASHAKAYHVLPEFEICGIVSRGESKVRLNEKLEANYPLFEDYTEALKITQPDAVCISTYPDTHEAYAIEALESSCDVFIEKPLADTVEGAERVAALAKEKGRKLVVGYILRVHPSWEKFVEVSRTMGKPLVMRMNLNQQSHGYMWNVHKNLMKSLSPIVDCAVHYIDIMCLMTQAKPIKVSAIGTRLTDEVPEWNYNYGQLQIHFDDGSIGWYEAGWGPMMSQTAFFVKDVIGPKGCVSIVAKNASAEGKSDDVDSHTKTESIRVHYADIDANNEFVKEDEWIEMKDEPDHDELCKREQLYFLRAIQENLDLTDHWNDAINSLKVAFACDKSVKTGEMVEIS